MAVIIKKMNVKIELEDFTIISTGSIIGIVDQLFIFKFEDLLFEFKFVNNPNFHESKISSIIPEDGKKMTLLFENFNEGGGLGNIVPLEVGYISHSKLYLNYRVDSLSDNSGKLLHYTWLLEKKKGAKSGK